MLTKPTTSYLNIDLLSFILILQWRTFVENIGGDESFQHQQNVKLVSTFSRCSFWHVTGTSFQNFNYYRLNNIYKITCRYRI